MKVRASGSKYSFRAEVGPVKDDGQFVFGHTAEVHVGASYGSDVPVAEVSFAAIGSHSPEVARDRVAAYTAAISIAERINEADRRRVHGSRGAGAGPGREGRLMPAKDIAVGDVVVTPGRTVGEVTWIEQRDDRIYFGYRPTHRARQAAKAHGYDVWSTAYGFGASYTDSVDRVLARAA